MYSAIAANKRNTALMMTVFVLLVAAIGYGYTYFFADGNISIFLAILIGSGIYVLVQYYAAANMALALNGAKQISKSDNPRLYRMVENLSITVGLPMPKVYIMDDPAPNAFATGRDPKHSHIAVTSGLLEIMDDNELNGVLAHEMGHIQNYDIRVTMIAFGLTALVGLLADIGIRIMIFGGSSENRQSNPVMLVVMLVALILAPIVTALIRLAISRQREYLADATGALTTRYPEGLASALEKLAAHGTTMRHQNTSTAHLFFANPLKSNSFASLFATHPPLERRISRLRDNSSRF